MDSLAAGVRANSTDNQRPAPQPLAITDVPTIRDMWREMCDSVRQAMAHT